jgi:hypothetical protein
MSGSVKNTNFSVWHMFAPDKIEFELLLITTYYACGVFPHNFPNIESGRSDWSASHPIFFSHSWWPLSRGLDEPEKYYF